MQTGRVIGLLDIDPLVYACGFAAQHKRYIIKDQEGSILLDFRVKQVAPKDWRAIDKDIEPSKRQEYGSAYSRKELLAVVQRAYGAEDIEEYIHTDPVEFAYTMAKGSIQKIIEHSGCTHFVGVMSVGQCFRHGIATIKEYKGNRKNTPKPVYYQAMRDYFRDVWQALPVEYYEADDYLAMKAHQEPETTVIASIDKDLETVPGWHYNHSKALSPDDRLFQNTSMEAMTKFLGQILTGDNADNIPGLKGVGPKTRDKILDKPTLRERFEAVCERYEKVYGDEHTYPHWKKTRFEELNEQSEFAEGELEEFNNLREDPEAKLEITRDWKEILTENAQLLWMIRDHEEPLWNFEFFEKIIEEIDNENKES